MLSVGFCRGSRVKNRGLRVEGKLFIELQKNNCTMNKIFSNGKNPDISMVFV